MKFVCDRCQTRYSISDEKVRGKVLKIRCKTCSNIIVVREPTTAAQPAAASGAVAGAVAAGQGGARPPAPRTEVNLPRVDVGPRAGADVEWWVAIKGQQHGPMKAAEIERLFHEGQISAKSYAWNEGLPGWSRLRDLPDFAHLGDETPAAARRPPPPPPPADEAAGAQVVDLQEARAQRQGHTATPAAPAHDPFAAVAGATPAADAAPRESTRVFIMNAGLANRGRKHKTYAAVAVAVVVGLIGLGAADWMGYIQIPGLHSALSFAAESAGVEQPKRRQFLAAWDEAESDAAMRCKLAGIDCPEPKKRAGRRGGGGKGGTDGLNLEGAFGQGGAAGSEIGRAGGGAGGAVDVGDPLGSDDAKAAEIARIFGNDKKQALRPTAKVEAPSVSSGSGLDGEQIFKVVKDNQEAIKSCVESAAKQGSTVQGKQYLVVTIVPKGTVSQARFKNAVTSATPVGECIIKRAKKWKFPAFAGEAFDVEVPLILSTSF